MYQPAPRFPFVGAAPIAVAGAALAFALTTVAAPAAAEADAHALYEQNCTGCHGTEVYTRPDRKIGSLGALKTQVERCNTNLDKGMFPEEVKAVAMLLNDEYYKFEE
jgi:mono/diheme cytochrome c family protein